MKNNISIENIKNLLIEYNDVPTEEADKEVTKELIEQLKNDNFFSSYLKKIREMKLKKIKF
ncbi:hypothetical protein [Sulfurospirillum deleyianum]|uniref:Uncharacterized protein n=1 Tax=Sulfurospirillum deleyianum (strain ATCC 51133 / DSM 6946 / 5175) TaxID=525898 RepID=D1B0K4_SULD5|nr:hypothetical protein [Sulfurospirillum deleyianum]ACZ11323.1 hypothetical protein Sdel_0286 [Sulfurospirillum deleyianum DSM 6946]